jgi:hypothetical protein
MMKPLCIAVGLAFALAGPLGHAQGKSEKRADATAAQSKGKVSKTSRKHGSNVKQTRSDERIIDRCRNLHGAALALCLHEKRGDEYASLWRAYAMGNPSTATGSSSATGGTGATSAVTPTQPTETQPGVGDNRNASGR